MPQNERMDALHRALGLVADLLAPRACALCDQALAPDDLDWCPGCTREIVAAVAVDYCRRCGETASPHLVDEAGCKHCRGRRPPVDGFARVGPYDGPIGEMIRGYKFRRKQRLDRTLGVMLADAGRSRPWCATLDALVPVPASLTERWQYRFYPVGLLARNVGHRLGLPVLPMLTVRGKKRRQVELPHSDRVENVRGVFQVARHARVAGTRLCLVDDVTTSGATLAECARVLKRAGAAEVYAAILAKAGENTPPAPADAMESITL